MVPAILFYQTMSGRQFLLIAATKLRIAMVGRQIILTMGEICSAQLRWPLSAALAQCRN
jgi:hypothetical protein